VAEFVNYINLAAEDQKYASFAAICQKMIALDAGVEEVDVYGSQKIVAYQPISGTDGWSLGIVADRDEMLPTTTPI
jgi:methyl-accepting chemotaxis protein